MCVQSKSTGNNSRRQHHLLIFYIDLAVFINVINLKNYYSLIS
jgi:hypothetical protein